MSLPNGIQKTKRQNYKEESRGDSIGNADTSSNGENTTNNSYLENFNSRYSRYEALEKDKLKH